MNAGRDIVNAGRDTMNAGRDIMSAGLKAQTKSPRLAWITPAVLIVGLLCFGRLLPVGGYDSLAVPDQTVTSSSATPQAREGAQPHQSHAPDLLPTLPTLSTRAENQCPLPLDTVCYSIDYSQDEYLESWQGSSDLSVAEAAESMLITLRDAGWKLEEYGYLGLLNNDWGCLVSRQTADTTGEVLMITITREPEDATTEVSSSTIIRIVRISTDSIERQL